VRLTMTGAAGELEGSQTLIVAPPRCTLPKDLLANRTGFGVLANLYTLRNNTNWGIGDTGDLWTLVKWVGEIGGSFVGLNPLHARSSAKAPAFSTSRSGRPRRWRSTPCTRRFCDDESATPRTAAWRPTTSSSPPPAPRFTTTRRGWPSPRSGTNGIGDRGRP